MLLFNLLYAGKTKADDDSLRLEILYEVLCAPLMLTEETSKGTSHMMRHKNMAESE